MGDQDRRVRRSKRLLGDALMALMEEQDYRAITVRAITDHADVGYMTFYRYYQNKDDLLVERLQTMVQAALSDFTPDNCHDIGRIVFQHVDDHKGLFKVVLFHDAAASARFWIQERIAHNILHAPNLFPVGDDSLIPKEIAAGHIAASIVHLITWWMNHGYPHSVEHMGMIYERMILEPTVKAVHDSLPEGVF